MGVGKERKALPIKLRCARLDGTSSLDPPFEQQRGNEHTIHEKRDPLRNSISVSFVHLCQLFHRLYLPHKHSSMKDSLLCNLSRRTSIELPLESKRSDVSIVKWIGVAEKSVIRDGSMKDEIPVEVLSDNISHSGVGGH